MEALKKVFLICLGIGILMGVLAIFGNNPFHLIAFCFDWIVWFIDAVAKVVSGNQTVHDVLTTTPSEMGLIMSSYGLI